MPRSSVSDVALVVRMASRDRRACSGCSSNTSSATPACMETTASPCPTTSCTSPAIRMRSSSAALAARSRRARSRAAAATCTSAPSDQGSTIQEVQARPNRTGASASSSARERTEAVATTAEIPHAGNEIRSGRCLASSNIPTTMHSWTGPNG
jgi:hypothetical protein